MQHINETCTSADIKSYNILLCILYSICVKCYEASVSLNRQKQLISLTEIMLFYIKMIAIVKGTVCLCVYVCTSAVQASCWSEKGHFYSSVWVAIWFEFFFSECPQIIEGQVSVLPVQSTKIYICPWKET